MSLTTLWEKNHVHIIMRKVLLLEQIGLIANVKLYFFKISWGLPPRPPSHLPPQNGMEEHPKCTILKFKCQNFPPQTPREPTKNPPPLPWRYAPCKYPISSKKIKICSKHFQLGQPWLLLILFLLSAKLTIRHSFWGRYTVNQLNIAAVKFLRVWSL